MQQPGRTAVRVGAPTALKTSRFEFALPVRAWPCATAARIPSSVFRSEGSSVTSPSSCLSMQALSYWPLTPRRPMCNGSHFAGRHEVSCGSQGRGRYVHDPDCWVRQLASRGPRRGASSTAATRLQPNGVALARSRRHATGLAGRKRSSGKDGMGPSATGWDAAQRTAKPRSAVRIRPSPPPILNLAIRDAALWQRHIDSQMTAKASGAAAKKLPAG